MRSLALLTVLCAALLAGCAGGPDAGAPADAAAVDPEALARAVTPQHLKAHVLALAAIGRRSGGTRAVGTPGYQRSVSYVAGRLRAAGYRPRLHSFPYDLFLRDAGRPASSASRPAPSATAAGATS